MRMLLIQPLKNSQTVFPSWYEQAKTPGDDFTDKAKGFERRDGTFPEADKLDAIASHNLAFPQRHPILNFDGSTFVEKKRKRVFR